MGTNLVLAQLNMPCFVERDREAYLFLKEKGMDGGINGKWEVEEEKRDRRWWSVCKINKKSSPKYMLQ